MAELVRYTGDGDWSALYVDGVLDRLGDHYLIDERISFLAGVTDISSNDFLLGGEEAAKTLYEITVYKAGREVAHARAAGLRAQAAKLIAEAEEMESQV